MSELTLDPETTLNYKNYSIDIAFPNEKIGIEVNGNQHYNPDLSLKKYYQDRNDYFIENNWTIYQIHYSKVYDDNFVNNLIQKLKDNYDIGDIDYSFYIKKKVEHFCVTCGINRVWNKGTNCAKCSKLKRRKVERPSKEELLQMIKDSSLEAVGRKYGVTGNAVKKWLKTENIMTFDIFTLDNL